MKRFRKPLISLVTLAALLLGLSACGSKTGPTPAQSPGTSDAALPDGAPAAAAQTPEVDEAKAIPIVFSDGGVQTAADEEAVKVEGTDVTIRAPGEYLLSGSCKSGSVKVRKQTQGVVLVLGGLDLTADGTAAITCNKGTEVTIMAADGTVNSLSDTEKNNDESNPGNENAENAALKCKDGSRVLLCGTGALNVQGAAKNGIKGGAADDAGEGSLTVCELTLNVTSAGDGIKSDAELCLSSGSITVSASDDAVSSDTSVTVGASDAAGPALTVSDCTEGLEAPQVRLLSGNVNIHASDDGLNAVSESGTADITIAGGTVLIDAEGGDGLDSNGTVNITGGDVRVFSSSRSDNSPLDYGTDMRITGGTVLAVGSAGMAQGPNSAAQTYLSFSSGNQIGGPKGGGNSDSANSGFSLRAGDKVQILDEAGGVLAEAEIPRSADYVFFTGPGLTDGQSCSLCVNGETAVTAEATSELSAFGGIPDVGGKPGTPGGDFDPENMPEGFDPENMPEGFDPENMPQRPGGGFDPENMPEGFDPENMPQPPGGFDPENAPEGFDPENMPQPPGGGKPQRPGGGTNAPAEPASGGGSDL